MPLIFNNGVKKVTPASASALTVAIDGVTYTTAWDSSVATTIDNFVAAHAETLANKYIAVIDSTTTIDFYNTDGHSFSATTGSAADAYEKLEINQLGVLTESSSTVSVYATNNTNTSYDVVTLTFPTAAAKKRANAKLARNLAGGDFVSNIPCKAAVA